MLLFCTTSEVRGENEAKHKGQREIERRCTAWGWQNTYCLTLQECSTEQKEQQKCSVSATSRPPCFMLFYSRRLQEENTIQSFCLFQNKNSINRVFFFSLPPFFYHLPHCETFCRNIVNLLPQSPAGHLPRKHQSYACRDKKLKPKELLPSNITQHIPMSISHKNNSIIHFVSLGFI